MVIQYQHFWDDRGRPTTLVQLITHSESLSSTSHFGHLPTEKDIYRNTIEYKKSRGAKSRSDHSDYVAVREMKSQHTIFEIMPTSFPNLIEEVFHEGGVVRIVWPQLLQFVDALADHVEAVR